MNDISIDIINNEGENPILLTSDDNNEIIHSMTRKLHERETMCKSFEIQMKHLELQVTALQSREKILSTENEQLTYQLAVKDQDNLLLESKLREVAGFERTGGALDDLRGKLLEIANAKV